MNRTRKLTIVAATVFSVLSSASLANDSVVTPTENSDWQPVASEKLIKLPANIIEKRVQQDFNMSPMASRLSNLEQQMADTTEVIANLKKEMTHADGDALLNLKYELVQHKSDYLDFLQESHELRQDAANKTQRVYQDVLSQLRNQYGSIETVERLKVQEQQQAALKRMEKVMGQVDQNLMHNSVGEQSPYSDEYAANVSQIEKLKQAINQHSANSAPTLNGDEVTSEEYVRQLLMDSSKEQSLLDQEGLMLSYMARLVALDAQALEFEIAYGEEQVSPMNRTVARASSSVEIFL